MSAVTLRIEGDPPLSPVRLRGVERLGEASTFELDLRGPREEPVSPASVLRKAARIRLDGPAGGREVAGVVTRFTVIAGDHEHDCAYRITVQSSYALLAWRRLARTFQDLAAPEIVESVARDGGSERVRANLLGSYAKRRYVVQYQESDAAFVRRICEDFGLYFRFEVDDGGERLVLEDDSTRAEHPYPEGLVLVARIGPKEPRPAAVGVSRHLRRAVGKVTLHDYDPEQPRLELAASAAAGRDTEADVEVYAAPGGFTSPDEGAARARVRLESLRAEASRVVFDTNALALAPGLACRLVDAAGADGVVAGAGDYVVTAVTTRWDTVDGALVASIDAIPRAVPFRLPRITPRPRIPGVQSAWVSGEEGREIHPDRLGRVHLRFHWDVHGAADHRSSPPVRTLQSHLESPLVVPRVGWEVFVMFEDGDPDCPYLVGRSYNAKQPPPLPLPANKTVTSIATDSSPGAGARTVIQMDDAAGREHMLFRAPSALIKTIAEDHTLQTEKNENVEVGATLSLDVGGSESTSVHLGYLGGYGARSIVVGAAQHQSAGGDFVSQVGTETDIVGGALVEQVGNPVKGAANLALSHALSWAGTKGVAGKVAAAAAGAARAAYEGYEAQGAAGAIEAVKGSAIGSLAALVPGGEAILAQASGSSKPMPWDHGRPDTGEAAPGGGAAGAGGADGGPAGPGPGHRNVIASGSYAEAVGAAYTLMTPGPVSWVTAGAATDLINGSHTTTAAKAGLRVGGGLGEWLGSLQINSKGFLVRKVAGVMRSSIDGTLTVRSGGPYALSAKSALTLKVGGGLTLGGSTVTFKCGAAELVASPDGLELKAPVITINGSSRQAGSLTHR